MLYREWGKGEVLGAAIDEAAIEGHPPADQHSPHDGSQRQSTAARIDINSTPSVSANPGLYLDEAGAAAFGPPADTADAPEPRLPTQGAAVGEPGRKS